MLVKRSQSLKEGLLPTGRVGLGGKRYGGKPVTEAADLQFIASGRRAFCKPVKVR